MEFTEFVDMEVIGTLAGVVALVTGCTELAKIYIGSLNPKWWTLIFSIVFVSARQVFIVQDLTAAGAFGAFINLIICLLAATGLFEYVVKPIERKVKK